MTTTRLAAGDLAGLDAGELREHAAAYVTVHGWLDGYGEEIAHTIASRADVPVDDVLDDLAADAEQRMWADVRSSFPGGGA